MRDEYSPTVCCVGLGPAGIGATLALSQSHLAKRTLSLDVGRPIEDRDCSILRYGNCIRESPCQMISGVGGCSTVCSGKISGYPAGRNLASILGSERLAKEKLASSLKTLRNFLAFDKSSVSTKQNLAGETYRKLGYKYRFYPVYTFAQDQLARAYKSILLEIESKGVSLMVNTRVADIDCQNGSFALTALQGEREIEIKTRFLIIAVGRFGQDLLESFAEKVDSPSKEYHLDIGARLEFPIEICPNIDEFHKDLKLLFDSTRTFCLCKDGKIAPYRYRDIFVLEGFCDNITKTGFTNIAITIRPEVSKRNEEIFNETKRRLLEISGGLPVRQMLPEYLGLATASEKFESSIDFWRWGDVNQCFSKEISMKLRVAIKHFALSFLPKDQWRKVGVFAPEVDMRPIFRIRSDFSLIPRVYLVGDCTGKFRGILQAFCSGIISGENIIGGGRL